MCEHDHIAVSESKRVVIDTTTFKIIDRYTAQYIVCTECGIMLYHDTPMTKTEILNQYHPTDITWYY